jgi:polyferredoxin
MKYPHGLIRYATQNSLDQKLTQPQMLRRMFRPRVLIYGGVLLAITAAFAVSLSMRQHFRVDVVRDRMTLARAVDQGDIENLYRLQLMNATERSQRYHIEVKGIDGAELVKVNGNANDVDVMPAQALWVTLAVRMSAQKAQSLGAGAHPMRFEVVALGDASAKVSERSTFVVLH